jgi:hypothetical protein
MNFNIISKVSSFAFDLYPIVQEFFKGSSIEYTVTSGARVVDDELVFSGRSFSGLGLEIEQKNPSAY